MAMQRGGMSSRGIRSPSVRDVLQTDVVTVQPDESIQSAVEEMADGDVGSVVVVDNDDPVGILTDRKVALSLRETADMSATTAQDLISGDIVTATTEMNVFEVLDTLDEHTIRRAPVVDEDGTLAGIVTLDDILVMLSDEFSTAAGIIESQVSRL
jgi:CBS domain-containing protein